MPNVTPAVFHGLTVLNERSSFGLRKTVEKSISIEKTADVKSKLYCIARIFSKTNKSIVFTCSIENILVFFFFFCLVIHAPTEHDETSSVEAKKNTLQQSNRTLKVPTLKECIGKAFQQQLKVFHESGEQLVVGDAVLARMRGYLPWPGRIVNFTTNKKMVNCHFYGTNNSGLVGTKNIIPFPLGRETVRLVCLRPPSKFIKGVNELERTYNISEELSCLKELKSIK